MAKTKKALRATAFHEAGHAVMHRFLSVPFRYVTIKPEPDLNRLGLTHGEPAAVMVPPGH